MKKLPSMYIEISKSAIKKNHEFIQSILLPNVKFSSVVKGNAYGHGIEVMVPIMEELGVNHFSVFNGAEAMRVKAVCQSNSEIMVMGMLTHEELRWSIENEIEFFVFDLFRLNNALKLAKELKKVARIHLEVETGMNRTGISKHEIDDAIQIISSNSEFLSLYGVCTHLAGAESISNYYRIKKQLILYKKISNLFKLMELKPKYQHVSSSAGMIRYPEYQMDMVRIGIMQYGFFPTREVLVNYLTKHQLVDDPLRRSLSWKSQVMSIKDVPTSEFIGYGTAFFASNHMKIAIIPVGYAYGFTRSLTNQGKVIIHGEYAPVVGIVNMNMISVDVTFIPNVKIGDEIIIIGKDGDKDINVSSFGDISNQVNYELLTRLPSEIPRIIVD